MVDLPLLLCAPRTPSDSVRQNEPMCLLDPGLSGDVYSGLSRQSRMVCKLWVGVVQLASAQRDDLSIYIYTVACLCGHQTLTCLVTHIYVCVCVYKANLYFKYMYTYVQMCVSLVFAFRLARPQGVICAQTGAPSAYVALAGADERWRLRFCRCTRKLPLRSLRRPT